MNSARLSMMLVSSVQTSEVFPRTQKMPMSISRITDGAWKQGAILSSQNANTVQYFVDVPFMRAENGLLLGPMKLQLKEAMPEPHSFTCTIL